MPNFQAKAHLTVLGVTMLIGCSKSEAGSRPASSAPSAELALASAAPAASSKPMKEYVATPADRLGALPPGVGVPVGTLAPDAALEDFRGAPLKLSELFQKGPVLLAFYRGGWCPYCSFEIHDFVKAYPEYQARGVTPVAISVDRAEESSKTKAAFEIPFPVLSDPDLHAHEAFRVVHRADSDEVARLKGFGIDVDRSSGRTHHAFAVPALFLVDQTGKVRWAHADPDYKVRPRTPQILAALDATGFTPNKGQ